MTYLAGAVATLAVLALLACVVVLARDARAEQQATRQHLSLLGRALTAQLARQHEEHRRHIDAAAAAIVAQLAGHLAAGRPRFTAQVEVRSAPPLREEQTPPAGTPRPSQDRVSTP